MIVRPPPTKTGPANLLCTPMLVPTVVAVAAATPFRKAGPPMVSVNWSVLFTRPGSMAALSVTEFGYAQLAISVGLNEMG